MQKKARKDDTTGIDAAWEAMIKNRRIRKAVTTAEVDTPEDDSMVRFGGFIADNEDEAVEANAVKGGSGSNLKKPAAKGLYASISIIFPVFTLKMFKPIAVYSN